MEISEKKHRLPDSWCTCGHLLSGARGVDWDNRPEPGNLSVCMYCGVLRMYTADLTLRELTREELAEVMADQEMSAQIWRMRQAIHDARAQKD